MFLGLDIGTSGVKSTIVDGEGTMLAYAYRPLRIYGKAENKRELDPLEVKENAFETMKEVLHKCNQRKLAMITLSSLGEAAIPVGRDGKVLRRSIIGSDSRGAVELEWMKKQMSAEILTEITKVNLSYIYSLNKILYLRKTDPAVYEKTWKYMCFTDYMTYLLTGETMIDYSMASRTMAFDIHKNCWSEKILDIADIGKELFSTPVPGGSIIGNLLYSVKRELGLSYDVPVMVGSHDHIFNAIGAGAVVPGSCSNIVGTTEGITAVVDKMLDTKDIDRENISCEPFVRSGLYNTVAWHNTAGAMVNWYTETFWKENTSSKREILEYLSQAIDTHPGKLIVLPHFSGVTAHYMDEKAKGAIIGLTTTTTREEIFKAILEGASYECRRIIDAVEGAGIALDRMIVSGGGSNSALWLKLKANILGREIYKVSYADTGALGGAVLGATVMGDYSSIEAAADQMLKPPQLIEPDMKYHSVYQERYEKYKELYIKLKELNHMLHDC